MWNKYKPYVGFVVLCLGVGGIAAFLTRNNMDIYNEIIMPPLSPPSWTFGVVWSILYFLMGISAAIVFTKSGKQPAIFYVQLIFNFLWTIVFFNLRWFLFAAIWLAVLWILVLFMIKEFLKVDTKAGYLQIPYLLWITFALYLNTAIWILNK